MIKHLLHTILFVAVAVTLQAQSQTKLDASLRFVEQQAPAWGITTDDYQAPLVSDMYTDSKTGLTYVYLQQTVNGLPIANAVTSMVVDKAGKVYNIGHNFIPKAKTLVVEEGEAVSPTEAIAYAADALGVKAGPISSPRSVGDQTVFAELDFVHNEVKVKQEYVLVDNQLIKVWDMSLDVVGSADYWNTKISVADGTLVAKHNYTIYCQHKHGKFAKHKSCGATAKVADHNSVSVAAANAALSMGATYNAFSFPVESPIHGERTIISDDTYAAASPFGWHDETGDGVADYTITRGNNVHAYADRESTDFSNDDEPDGGMDLNFDYPYSLESEADDLQDASITNLFTANNEIHDITYLLGFNEPAGAFQQNNFGNGGAGSDPVIAQGFDGIDLSTPNLDNANFATPADGASGRMQMFLWQNSGGALSIDEPANIAGFITQIGTAVGNFGGVIPTTNDQPIKGKVVIARDNDPANPTQSCGDIANADEVAGNIALIDRGLCNFSLKAYNAQEAGALTCLICNVPGADGPGSSGEATIGMAAGDFGDDVFITPIFVQKSVCDRIRAEINNGVEVLMTLQEREPVGPAYRDASFDNGVIAHEYGHGISNRLIGGPGQAGCLNSAEQMGEGISDFVTLLLTVEEGDTREDARGIGNYVDHLAPDGGGIRTYPYSTDLAINPRTYSEVPGFLDANGAPLIYSIGEVWTIAMWEVYWNLVEKYGLDVTWQDETAGNFVAGRLFIEGMKLAPCNPTLVEMRDAVLTADEILYGGENELELWTGFAKRGLGWKATGGTSNDITDGTADFEIFPLAIKTLKLEKSANTLVTAGGEVMVTLTAANHNPEPKTGVVITDQVPEGATFVEGSASMDVTVDGTTLTFMLGDMAYEDEVEITYMLQVNEGVESTTLFYDNIDDTNSSQYEIGLIEGFNLWNTTTDDAVSGTTSLYVRESATEANDQTIQINNIAVTGERPVLRFVHKYDTEPILDGGFVRISTDGTVFELVSDDFIRNGYSSALEYSTFAIPNLQGYSGSSDGEWVDSYVDLSEYKGESISVQFRFGSNATIAANVPNPGWFVDDIEIFDLASFSSVGCIVSELGDDEVCSNDLEFIVNSNQTVSTVDPKFDHVAVTVGPNPATDYFTVNINSDRAETLQLDLTTIDGKLISSQGVRNSERAVRSFDVSDLATGAYFLTVRSQNEVVTTQKVIVQ